MDWGNLLGQWLLSQLEIMPMSLVRQGAELRVPSRLIDYLLGEREAEEVRALLSQPLKEQPRLATVFLPGIMGSLLASVRGISTVLWFNPEIITNGHINLLDLDDDGQTDRSPDVEIVPVGIEKLTYLKMIVTLARETRLYEFPYDWRRSLEWNADLLHRSLERWSWAAPERRFTLVGHSMGGMLARTYLARYPHEAEQKIERVIMLGSPLRGAAITTLVFSGGTQPSRVVSKLHPENDVVRFASNLPSVYQLLPAPPEFFGTDRPYPVDWDVYNAEAWGLPNVRQRYLDDARALHALWARADPQVEIIEIAGCHQRTVTDVCRIVENTAPLYEPRYQDEGEDSGDEQVPLWSTRQEGIKTYYVEENHQGLPANPQVLEAVVSLIQTGRCDLPETLPQPSGVLRTLRAIPFLQQVAELRQRLDAGRLLREDLAKLFFVR